MTTSPDRRRPPFLNDALSKNPHCQQLASGSLRGFVDPALRPLTAGVFSVKAFPRMVYRRRPVWERSANHWGQLKLLVIGFHFLDLRAAADKNWLIVYAGRAPGDYISTLLDYFLNCRAILYCSPGSGCMPSRPHDRMTVVNADLTVRGADSYRDREDVLFICDLRRPVTTPPPADEDADDPQTENPEVEAATQVDMELQARLCRAMWPTAALLRFRLPWAEGFTRYFRGRLWALPWSPTTSTETRLMVTRGDLRRSLARWDHTTHEQRMMFFNSVGRVRLYDHGLDCALVPGLDHCADCAITVLVARAYLRRRLGRELMAETVAELINRLVDSCSQTSRILAHRVYPSLTASPEDDETSRRDR